MKQRHLGEFEELVLLAVGGLGEEAYAVPIQQRIEERAGRAATMGPSTQRWIGWSTKAFSSRASARRRGSAAANANAFTRSPERGSPPLRPCATPANACGTASSGNRRWGWNEISNGQWLMVNG